MHALLHVGTGWSGRGTATVIESAAESATETVRGHVSVRERGGAGIASESGKENGSAMWMSRLMKGASHEIESGIVEHKGGH